MAGASETSRPSGPSQVLVRTKLHAPVPRQSLVPRPRLIDLLDSGLSVRLILVSGPAGFGKTTLIAEWLRREPRYASWLSLDETDNDPAGFLAYVIAAIQTVLPGAGSAVSSLLRSSQPPPVEYALSVLLNDLASVSRDLVLVLDDYHAITDPAIHSAVAFLLERLPARVHLVISTRFDPPFPLARLRSREQLLEVRADSLRFTLEETAAFLSGAMGLSLRQDQMSALTERTEGWVAGLQMAGLSLQGRGDTTDFITAFTGTNRFILDFLVEEVLSRESEEVREFLLQTSILGRLSGPLCDHVTGAMEPGSGAEMLERLERRSLFVVPLDEERTWYRYHQLFAEMLLNQLRRVDPRAVASLHARASEWYEAEGLPEPAFHHASAAGDWRRAGALVAAYWMPVGHSGRAVTVLRWLQALPDEAVRSDPWLNMAYAWIKWLVGDVRGARDRLEAASDLLAQPGVLEQLPAQHLAMMRSGVTSLRSLVARQLGEVGPALRSAEESIRLAPEGAALMKGLGFAAMGHCLGEMGETARCIESLRASIELLWKGANHFAAMMGGYSVARIERLGGHLHEPLELCHSLLRRAANHGLAGDPAVGVLHLGMALVLVEHDRLEEAEDKLQLAEQLGKHAALVDISLGYAMTLARLRLARGDVAGSVAAMAGAERVVADVPLAMAEFRAYRARLHVAEGKIEEASRWAEWAENRQGDDRGHAREAEAIVIARVRLAEGSPGVASRLLTERLRIAMAGGRSGRAIEILLLLAIARERLGEEAEAVADLGRSLELAEPEGYARTFLEEGEPLRLLLRRGVALGAWSERASLHASRLLDAFSAVSSQPSAVSHVATAATTSAHHSSPMTHPPVVEPLSEREMEVLRLISEGSSNQEIAEQLYLTLNTVKKHSSNIFGKLGVSSRTQAVARARELGIL